MKQRTLLVLTIVAVFVAALWWTSRPPGRLVGDAVVTATVVGVDLRQRGPDKGVGPPVLVTVRLADGGVARLWMAPPGPPKESTVELRIRRYDDGSRRVSPAR